MNWQHICLAPTQSLREVMAVIDRHATGFAMIVDGGNILMGVVTDGNIRRALLAEHTLETPIQHIMRTNPQYVGLGVTAREALRIMEHEDFTHLPVLDGTGSVVGIWSRKALSQKVILPNTVVLMVGGLGSRLGDLTEHTPKPLLPVAGKPMLEYIIEHCIDWGLRRFIMAVNYKAQKIREHFGDGNRFGCHIDYVQEKKRLGTAGALSLIAPPTEDFFVMNGDVLSHVNLHSVLRAHQANSAPATMVVKPQGFQVPYGVVERDAKGAMLGIIEKPTYTFAVSAGIYVLHPHALAHVPRNTFFDMPELFQALIEKGQPPHTYEAHEYWIDVGRVQEYVTAQEHFAQ